MDTKQESSNNSELGPHPQSLIEVLHDVELVDHSLPNRSSCWQDVIDAIESATAQDNAKAERSSVRARLRKSGPELAVLESLAGMIPDQDGLCVLRGGLTTLCRVSAIPRMPPLPVIEVSPLGFELSQGASQMMSLRLETRAKILRAFEGIPETFFDAVEAGMRFPGATDLVQAVRQLYHTLVENVAILIGILLRSHPHKNRGKFHASLRLVDLGLILDPVVRLWKQRPGKEAEVVDNCLVQVTRAAERVDRCSRAATERTVGQIHVAQHSILASNVAIDAEVKAVKSGVDGIQAAIVDGMTRLELRLSGTDREKNLETATEKMLEAAELLKGLRNGDGDWYHQPYLSVYAPAQLTLPWLRIAGTTVPRGFPVVPSNQTEVTLYQQPVSPPGTSLVSLEELLMTLDVPEDAAAEALAGVTRRSYHLKVDVGTRSNRLMEMKRFKKWLEAPAWASDLILVDGHCGNVAADKVTPMSAICASLARTVMNFESNDNRDRPVPIVIHHFCGQHLGRPNPLNGPNGLIRNLVHQLLVQSHDVQSHLAVPAPYLEFIDEQLLAGIDYGGIPRLCRLFSELFVRIDPSRPVFCIIDGVSELETTLYGWQEDTVTIVDTLLALVKDLRPGPALRVLLTSPQRSATLAESVVTLDRHVSLPAAHTLGKRSYVSLLRGMSMTC
ncbi:hypothetical protein CHGG_09554 [Chaetomium globosum CBS 148.51]|uniref:Nephrocystin 3-like N-terminal domain-containing protein n=1 Tax=Chaetomium globosum (strain ATCC 6205 / CBS 148.51 / DSM 1962 / NBRC 6347 / NRRL 1970) TaxID=306901 RepID=Q2GR50_CHAGB|nr:uncharacterized protein CHGG_09554 [Chaetomium globosum CBS 148.51]EAQ85540.1 hypothetical protein CHGG_09554 [Chaetomium globosum CBS 148.51]